MSERAYSVRQIAAAQELIDAFPTAEQGKPPSLEEALLLQNPNGGEALPPGAVAGLLDAALDFLDRYLVLPGDAERHALALFVAHTWAFDGAHSTPYLLPVSPERRSGKTRLLEALELLVARPWRVIGASEAALFRKIEKDKPTLLLDELDAVFGSHAERTEPLRAVLNGGNRPGATVSRCIGEGREVENYSIYCPKVLAGIDSGDRIPDTIRDRAITIHMQRKTFAEPVERFRYRDADADAEPIRDGFRRWAEGVTELLLAAEPGEPPELDDRAADSWEPLLAIADLAGGEWPARAREAAVKLSGGEDRDEVATGSLLLGAIRKAFGDEDRMGTGSLLGLINGDEELPFGGWRDGHGLDSRLLAELLRPYGVKPQVIRLGEGTPRGYLREQFSNAFARWLPAPPTGPQQAQQAQQTLGTATQKPLEQADVADVADVAVIPGGRADVADVAGISANGDGPADGQEAVSLATPEEQAEAERIAAKHGEEL